mgnify:CR=1 FL=1
MEINKDHKIFFEFYFEEEEVEKNPDLLENFSSGVAEEIGVLKTNLSQLQIVKNNLTIEDFVLTLFKVEANLPVPPPHPFQQRPRCNGPDAPRRGTLSIFPPPCERARLPTLTAAVERQCTGWIRRRTGLLGRKWQDFAPEDRPERENGKEIRAFPASQA